jgi:hypothetical protein
MLKSHEIMKLYGLLLGFIFLGTSCEKSADEKSVPNSKDYDANQPKVSREETSSYRKRASAGDHAKSLKISVNDAQEKINLLDKNDSRNFAQIEVLLAEIAASDPNAALTEIAKCPAALQFILSQSDLMKFFTELSVEELAKNFAAVGSGGSKLITNFKMVTLLKIVNKDANKALELLSKMPDGNHTLLLDPTINALAVRNGESSLQMIASTLSPKLHMQAYSVAIQAIGRDDPRSAIALVASYLKGNEALESYRSITDSYITKNPDQMRECMDSIPSSFLPQILNQKDLVSRILKLDPSLAISMLKNVPLTSTNRAVVSNIVTSLAKVDQEQALLVLSSLPKSGQKDQVTRELFEALAAADSENALKTVDDLPAENQIHAMRAIAKVMTETDFEKAIEIAKKVMPSQQQDVYREIARSSAYESPQNAISMINDAAISEKLGNDFRNEMINHTVQNWAKQSLEEAQQWVEKLPATDQPKGVQGLVATWMKSDPIAASEWLSKQSAGPARDAGAQEIINQIKDTDPEMAEQWRKSMTPKTE